MVASSATTRRSLALTVPSTAASSNAVGRAGSASGRSELTIRGEPAFRARIYRATTLYSVGPRTRTMMQSCASVAKLRSGGPILCYGVISHGVHRVTATSNRHWRPVTSGQTGPKLLGAFYVLLSLCGTQNDAVRHHALPHEPPQGDQKLARQGHDHGLASAAGVLGAGSEPLCQGAVLLEQEKSPRQLDHAPPNPRIPGSRQSFLAALLPALVGRASEARITRYGACQGIPGRGRARRRPRHSGGPSGIPRGPARRSPPLGFAGKICDGHVTRRGVASFDWRCLSGSTMAPFPHPAHRTGQADFPHPALGQDFTLCFRVQRHL